MSRIRLFIAAVTALLLLPMGATAQSLDELRDMSPAERQAYVQSLSPEERETLRAAMKERWESMSEEEREAIREKRREMKAKRREAWNNMSDEEKAAARAKMRERRAEMRESRDERGKTRERDPSQQ